MTYKAGQIVRFVDAHSDIINCLGRIIKMVDYKDYCCEVQILNKNADTNQWPEMLIAKKSSIAPAELTYIEKLILIRD